MKVGNLVGVQKADIFFTPKVFSAKMERAEEVTVKGKVTDANGQPLAGVSLEITGTNKGTVTNETGAFVITVQTGSVIKFSMVGYDAQDVKIEKETELSITLQLQNKALNEVVVTALGVKKEKVKVAYAVQEVKGEVLQKAPETNVASNLVGKVAGLSIYTKSTLFENPEVYLRGQSTLIVIDGIPTQTDFWNIIQMILKV